MLLLTLIKELSLTHFIHLNNEASRSTHPLAAMIWNWLKIFFLSFDNERCCMCTCTRYMRTEVLRYKKKDSAVRKRMWEREEEREKQVYVSKIWALVLNFDVAFENHRDDSQRGRNNAHNINESAQMPANIFLCAANSPKCREVHNSEISLWNIFMLDHATKNCSLTADCSHCKFTRESLAKIKLCDKSIVQHLWQFLLLWTQRWVDQGIMHSKLTVPLCVCFEEFSVTLILMKFCAFVVKQ